MDQQGAGATQNGETDVAKQIRSLPISERGIKTGKDFANLMSALMSDIISGRIPPDVGNAAVNAGGKLLKVVEMQYRFGTRVENSGERVLVLAQDTE